MHVVKTFILFYGTCRSFLIFRHFKRVYVSYLVYRQTPFFIYSIIIQFEPKTDLAPVGQTLQIAVRRRPSSVNMYLSRSTGPIFNKCGMQYLQGKATENCKFHETPPQRRNNFWVKSVKLKYFFKIYFSTPGHRSEKLSLV